MSENRTRKLAALMAGAAVALAACGGAPEALYFDKAMSVVEASESADASSEQQTAALEIFSWWTSGSESAALKEIVDGFTRSSSGVTVKNGAVTGGGGGNAQSVLQARLQAGDPPDTWMAHPGASINQYISSGVAADVSSIYVDGKLSDVMPKELVDTISMGGKQFGVNAGAHRGNVLWFNTKMLVKAGVAAPGASYSAAEFLRDLAKVKAAGMTPLCLGAKDTFAVAELFENVLLGAVGPDGWNSLAAGKTPWNSPKVKEAAATFVKIIEFADPDASKTSWDQATKKLARGECAFNSMGDWAYGELRNGGANEGTDFGYTAHPGTAGSFIAVVDTFVMAKSAKNARNARSFMAALASKEVQLAFSLKKGSVPVRTDIDVSSLSPYQQGSAKSLARDSVLQSIIHGEAVSSQFAGTVSAAAVQLARAKDVGKFVASLESSA